MFHVTPADAALLQLVKTVGAKPGHHRWFLSDTTPIAQAACGVLLPRPTRVTKYIKKLLIFIIPNRYIRLIISYIFVTNIFRDININCIFYKSN